MARPPKTRTRRGALLLVVLSMLVLFALIALTFVVVAGSFNRSAKAAGRVGITDDEGRQLVERAFLDLLRGSNSAASVPSLLEDLYGNDSVVGDVNVTNLLGDETTAPLLTLYVTGTGLNETPYAYSGCVLTMTSGSCKGLSTRIVQSFYDNISAIHFLLIEPFAHPTGINVRPSEVTGDKFMINGRPFNGTGGTSDPDEGWDAPDAQNPHLALIPETATTSAHIISSFAERLVPLTDVNGDGTLNASDLIAIDNDRDGILDSGWINVGYPIRTASDGRRTKPFVSILCIDLDGRLNLNAHGSLAQTVAGYTTGQTAAWASSGGTTSQQDFPRGMGFGPADVQLNGVFANATKRQAFIESRYGSDVEPGPAGATIDNHWRLNSLTISSNFSGTSLGGTANGFGSPPDVIGRGAVGVDHGGRPMYFNMGLSDEIEASPYQMNLVRPNGHDKPYTVAELERILRWNDVDSKSLPELWDRSANLSAADFDNIAVRRSVTVVSSHLPVPAVPVDVVKSLYDGLTDFAEGDGGSYTFPRNDEMRSMLPFEVLKGGKMNVNRFWGNGVDNSSPANLIVDETNELGTVESISDWTPSPYAAAPQADYLNSAPDVSNQSYGRYIYARNLFCLMYLLMDRGYRLPISEATLDTDDAKKQELTIRRIAQWAINCVDARDPDAIMTPFEYDVNPFNGWNVDGDLTTDDGSHADRRVVWGMEFPELRFTESLATHDRRVRDTDWDNKSDVANETATVTNTMYNTRPGLKRLHPDWVAGTAEDKYGDKDLDQYRIPQGSLFLEFYATRALTTQNPVVPRELYTAAGELDLTRRDNNNSGNNPVWRVAISEPQQGDTITGTKSSYSPHVLRGVRPDSATFHPPHMTLYNDGYTGTLPEYVDVTAERDTANYLAIERYIWFSTQAPATAGDEYNTFRHRAGATSVAPGEYLVVGPRTKTFFGSRPDGGDNAKDLAAPARQPNAPTLKATQQLHFQAGGSGITYTDASGASASYPKPVKWMVVGANAPSTWTSAGTTAPSGIGVNVSEPLPSGNYYTEPTHSVQTDAEIPTDAYGDGSDANAKFLDKPLDNNRLLGTLGLLETGKTENFRTAFLQRLANPLLAYHVVTNPYITVDWIPIDLSVYNGEDLTSDEAAAYAVTDSAANGDHPGWFDDGMASGSPFDPDDGGADPALGTRHIAGANQNLWSQDTVAQTHTAGVDQHEAYLQHTLNGTLGYLNSSFGQPYASGAAAGDPQDGPFPWLYWPNRPYTNQYELMLMPASQSARLGHEFGVANTGDPYTTTPMGMFAHLLNFYGASPTPGVSPHFYRVFDFLDVSSPFAGACERYAPDYVTSTLVPSLSVYGTTVSPPFHSLSKFRDPGRVNINTIPGNAVWQGIDPGAAFTPWLNVDASRKGTAEGGPDALKRFTTAFRPAVSGMTGTAAASNVERSLLQRGANASTSTFNNLPLFGAPNTTNAANDAIANAYFRLQGAQRMGNVLTTQSNVYAIWITIGYFEVDEAGVPIRELNSDTGEITRHRGFYIVDRSIPVAFERGKSHNVDNCVLLRRYIE